MWEINNSFQIISFGYSMILGMIFGIFYDIFKSLRSVKKHKNFVIFIEDILFFFVVSIITLLFLIATTNGEVRGYILFGILAGFIIYILLFSKYIILIFFAIFKLIFTVVFTVLRGYYWLFEKIYDKFRKILINTVKNLKKVLKYTTNLLYTIRK